MSKAKPNASKVSNIKRHILDAFDGWKRWAGSYDAAEQKEFSDMVSSARNEVFTWIAEVETNRQLITDQRDEALAILRTLCQAKTAEDALTARAKADELLKAYD